MREEHREGGMKMNSFRIETIMTVFDYHAFEFFGKLPYRLALYYFLYRSIKLVLNHWEKVFSKKFTYVVTL